ncbi:hypothetical protein Pcinc_010785 [Petrolisthes cinctipes]|uniref:Sulfotransferase domain-containing protein n=1 Tax=Petrolisthes cinctipes TaxID=88211 RepID=A0AAE1G4S4_PETCI|nr:hypothetical protein Pcinc_010785 [Petrolisthes cinctipes]
MSKQRLLTGHEVEPMSEEWLTKMAEEQSTFTHGVVRILPDGWLCPGTTPCFLNRIQSFKFRPDDVILMTFPNSGTTWMKEILWTMLFNPNLDNPRETQPLLVRSASISQSIVSRVQNLGSGLNHVCLCMNHFYGNADFHESSA